MRKSHEQLKEELAEASDIQAGTRWMHHKGAIVDIIALGHMAMPDGSGFDAELCVIYNHDRHIWVRPVTLFRSSFAPLPPWDKQPSVKKPKPKKAADS